MSIFDIKKLFAAGAVAAATLAGGAAIYNRGAVDAATVSAPLDQKTKISPNPGIDAGQSQLPAAKIANPTPREIELWDALRRAGIDRDAAGQFLASFGLNVAKDSEPQFSPSNSHPGRLYVDFGKPDTARQVVDGLKARGVEATVYTGDGVPEGGSSLYLDGKYLLDYAHKLGDITSDPKAFAAQIANPLSQVINAHAALKDKSLGDIRAHALLTSLYQDKGLKSSLLDNLPHAIQMLDQAMRALDESHIDGARDMRSDLVPIIEKLDNISLMETAPRPVAGQMIPVNVDADGQRVMIERHHGDRVQDFTWTPEQGAPHWTEAQIKAYAAYAEKFKKDGLQYADIMAYKGTFGQFLAELNDVKSPMAVALKAATGGKETPADQADNANKFMEMIYVAAINNRPDYSQIRANWDKMGQPWLTLPAKSAGQLYEYAYKLSDKHNIAGLVPYSKEIANKIADVGGLSRLLPFDGPCTPVSGKLGSTLSGQAKFRPCPN